jgi:hypothetical protein
MHCKGIGTAALSEACTQGDCARIAQPSLPPTSIPRKSTLVLSSKQTPKASSSSSMVSYCRSIFRLCCTLIVGCHGLGPDNDTRSRGHPRRQFGEKWCPYHGSDDNQVSHVRTFSLPHPTADHGAHHKPQRIRSPECAQCGQSSELDRDSRRRVLHRNRSCSHRLDTFRCCGVLLLPPHFPNTAYRVLSSRSGQFMSMECVCQNAFPKWV